MKLRSLVTAALGMGLAMAVPAVAEAYTSYTTDVGQPARRARRRLPQLRRARPPGTPVDVHYCQPGWCRTSSYLGTGWVSSRYLAGAPRVYPPVRPIRRPYPVYPTYRAYPFYRPIRTIRVTTAIRVRASASISVCRSDGPVGATRASISIETEGAASCGSLFFACRRASRVRSPRRIVITRARRNSLEELRQLQRGQLELGRRRATSSSW